MKIRIITTTRLAYNLTVDNDNFDEVVSKLLEKKYLKISDNLVIVTSSISAIQRIA